jgi:hypothetical protein
MKPGVVRDVVNKVRTITPVISGLLVKWGYYVNNHQLFPGDFLQENSALAVLNSCTKSSVIVASSRGASSEGAR